MPPAPPPGRHRRRGRDAPTAGTAGGTRATGAPGGRRADRACCPGVAPPGADHRGRGIPPGPGRGPPDRQADRPVGHRPDAGRAAPRRTGRCRPAADGAGLGAAGPGHAGRVRPGGPGGAAGAAGDQGAGGAGRSGRRGRACATSPGRRSGGIRRHLQPGRWLSRVRPSPAPQPSAERLARAGATTGGFHGGRRRFDELRPVRSRRARTSLLVTPSSFPTRARLGLTWCCHYISSRRRQRCRPRLGFSYDAWSSGLHGVLMFFATCSLDRGGERCEVLDHRGGVRCTGDAQRSAEACRRTAAVHSGRRDATTHPGPVGTCLVSTETAGRPFPPVPPPSGAVRQPTARQPMHVRTGGASRRSGPGTLALDHGSVYRHRGRFRTALRWESLVRWAPVRRAGGRAGRFGVAADVDPPAGQAGRQPGVLPSRPMASDSW